MADEHARVGPAPTQATPGSAPAQPVAFAGPLPPLAVLARADAGTRARVIAAAQRGHGNAYVSRQVAAAKPRPKWMPKPEAEWTAAERAHVAAERANQDRTAGGVKAKYEQLANAKLAQASTNFSALELGKDHVQQADVEQTPVTAAQVATALATAWQAVFGQPIPAGALRILVGKWVAEGGEKGIYGYNLGNMQPSNDRAKEPPIADWAIRKAPENTKAGGTEQRQSPFYAFKSLEQGATALIYYIVGIPRNRALFGALMFGDARDYVYAMKGCGYMTAAVENISSPIDGQLLQTGYLNLVNVGMGRFGPEAASKVLDSVPAQAAQPDLGPRADPPVPLPEPPPEEAPPAEPPPAEPPGGGGAGGAPSSGNDGAEGHGPT